MDYSNFDPKNLAQWQQAKAEGAQAVQGINAMPYVLGNGAAGQGYSNFLGANAGDPQAIKDQIFNHHINMAPQDRNLAPLLAMLGLGGR